MRRYMSETVFRSRRYQKICPVGGGGTSFEFFDFVSRLEERPASIVVLTTDTRLSAGRAAMGIPVIWLICNEGHARGTDCAIRRTKKAGTEFRNGVFVRFCSFLPNGNLCASKMAERYPAAEWQ